MIRQWVNCPQLLQQVADLGVWGQCRYRVNKGLKFWVPLGQFYDDGMGGGECNVLDSKEGVWTGGEDVNCRLHVVTKS